MKIRNTEVKILKGDITSLPVDAFVCTANIGRTMDKGLGKAVLEKGGKSIKEELGEKRSLRIGESVWTNQGELNANYIIHTATSDEDFNTDEAIIREATASALRCASKLKVESIAFPALGCGVADFPKIGAAKIMAQEILKFIRYQETSLSEIIFCLFDQDTFQVFEQTVGGYLQHIQDTLGEGPYVTVDAIIELPEGIILIERSNPPYGWALPGGFVDYGESLETAVRREAKEETNMELEDLRQFHTYSEPGRDPRFHTVSTVFIGKGKGTPQAGDDAKSFRIVKYDELLNLGYAFDHKKVIEDYIKEK